MTQDRKRLIVEEVYSSSDEGNGDIKDEDLRDEDVTIEQYRKMQHCFEQNSINKDAFILVKLCGKKIIRHYIAQVLSVDQNDEFTVSFLKKTRTGFFAFPERLDISVIDRSDIMKILSKPHLNEMKSEYSFEDTLRYENLY